MKNFSIVCFTFAFMIFLNIFSIIANLFCIPYYLNIMHLIFINNLNKFYYQLLL